MKKTVGLSALFASLAVLWEYWILHSADPAGLGRLWGHIALDFGVFAVVFAMSLRGSEWIARRIGSGSQDVRGARLLGGSVVLWGLFLGLLATGFVRVPLHEAIALQQANVESLASSTDSRLRRFEIAATSGEDGELGLVASDGAFLRVAKERNPNNPRRKQP